MSEIQWERDGSPLFDGTLPWRTRVRDAAAVPHRNGGDDDAWLYSCAMSEARAKLLRSDGSQAVQLPQEFRFPEGQSEVIVRREGNRLIIEPLDEWPDDFRSCLGAWVEEIERPEQPPLGELRDPFE